MYFQEKNPHRNLISHQKYLGRILDKQGSETDRECHARVGPILKLAYLKENKLFLATKARRHLQLFDNGPILSVKLPDEQSQGIGI